MNEGTERGRRSARRQTSKQKGLAKRIGVGTLVALLVAYGHAKITERVLTPKVRREYALASRILSVSGTVLPPSETPLAVIKGIAVYGEAPLTGVQLRKLTAAFEKLSKTRMFHGISERSGSSWIDFLNDLRVSIRIADLGGIRGDTAARGLVSDILFDRTALAQNPVDNTAHKIVHEAGHALHNAIGNPRSEFAAFTLQDQFIHDAVAQGTMSRREWAASEVENPGRIALSRLGVYDAIVNKFKKKQERPL